MQERDLVRAIYAAGHTIGIAPDPEDPDPENSLLRANDALDSIMFFRSVLALVPVDAEVSNPSLHLLREPETMSVEELRKLVGTLCPDPVAVPRLLGYSTKDIRRFLKAAEAEREVAV